MIKNTERLQYAALVAEILGGVAVVVSVIYLALQLSDNNRLLRSQSHYNALEVLQRPLEAVLESDTLSDLLQQCEHQPQEVSDTSWSRCESYYLMQINGWEYTYYQNLDQAVPPYFWRGVDGYMGNEARTNAGWVRFWEENAIAFGEPFRSYVEDQLESTAVAGPLE